MTHTKYGLKRKCWNEAKRLNLASHLQNLLDKMYEEGKFDNIPEHRRPHIEIDTPYTWIEASGPNLLSKEITSELIRRANMIYVEKKASSKK